MDNKTSNAVITFNDIAYEYHGRKPRKALTQDYLIELINHGIREWNQWVKQHTTHGRLLSQAMIDARVATLRKAGNVKSALRKEGTKKGIEF